MEDKIMNILWVALIIIVVISYIFFQKETKKINTIFKKLAEEKSGKIKKIFGYYPQLIFPYKDTELLISSISAGTAGTGGTHTARPAQTFVQIYLDDTSEQYFFDIQRKSTQTIIDSLLGFQHIKIDKSKFDTDFAIYGKDKVFIKALLSDDIQKKMLNIDSNQALKIRLSKNKSFDGKTWSETPTLSVSIDKIATTQQDYDNLIDLSTLIYKQIQKATT